jgi:ACS family tartrate transporter-like MFS transporter
VRGAAIASQLESELQPIVRKVAARIVPFVVLLYFVSFLDRVNVGFAALTMNSDLKLSPEDYGRGAGIFFVGYFLFAVPANLLLRRIGAVRWIGTITLVWGLVSLATAFIETRGEFYALRFLLGIAESGFMPGVILYLTCWFPDRARGRILSYFLIAVPLSSALGAPFSGWLLTHSIAGLRGWQSMFLVEALPAIALGLATFACLPDDPRRVRWMKEQERAALVSALDRDAAAAPASEASKGVLNARLWALGLLYFLFVVGVYGFAFWAPQILKAVGQLTPVSTGWATAIPYACTVVTMYWWGKHSDISGERIWHVALPAFLSAAGFVIAGTAHSVEISVLGFTLASVGMYAAVPVFWTLPTALVSGAAAASGIALVNSLGNLAGFAGPYMMGALKESSGGYAAGIEVLAGSMVAAGLLALAFRSAKAPSTAVN